MSATVLISGKLFRDPEAKTSRANKPYAFATVKIGQGDDAQWWRVMAFGDADREELLALRNGDAVSVSGTLKVELYTPNGGEPRVSLSVLADRLISARRAKREKTADARAERQAEPRRLVPADRHYDDGAPF